MENILALSGFLSFVFGITLLVVFFVMASNIGSIVKILSRMESKSISMDQSLEWIKAALTKEENPKLSDQEKARRFDQAR